MNIEQKGTSSADQTSAGQTGPRYSLLFNIPFFFNIHLYMIWHLMCQFTYYTVFQNLQLKCNSGDEIIKKFSTGFGFFKRSKRKKTFIDFRHCNNLYTFVITKCFWLWYAGIPDNKKQLFFLIEKSKEDIKTFNGTGTWANFFTRVKL